MWRPWAAIRHGLWLRICRTRSVPHILDSWHVNLVSQSETTFLVTSHCWRIRHSRSVTPSLAVHHFKEVSSQEWRVMNPYSPLVTRDLGLLSRESWVTSPPVVTRDLKCCIWMADLICRSRIEKHGKSQVTDNESRVASGDSWLRAKSRVTTDGRLWSS